MIIVCEEYKTCKENTCCYKYGVLLEHVKNKTATKEYIQSCKEIIKRHNYYKEYRKSYRANYDFQLRNNEIKFIPKPEE